MREAAALMRARAEAATPGTWWIAPNAEHMASWHPAVTLAVADWLDATAREFDALGDPDLAAHPKVGRRTAALATGTAYLGTGTGPAGGDDV